MKQILQHFKETNLMIKLKRCTFGAQKCTYVGHKIGQGELLPEESRYQPL